VLPGEGDDVEEIAVEQTLAQTDALRPPRTPVSQRPQQNRPVIPLLDAALSSLLVMPHEASVGVHPTGLVIIALAHPEGAREGSICARADAVLAVAGTLRREAVTRRPAPSAEPFRDGPEFRRISGVGQLVLAPPSGTNLLPLEMDADVAFLREELVVAFDDGLLCDLGRLRQGAGGESIPLVRFRGDGVIVLGLDRPFVAFDLHGDEKVALRADALVGWIGTALPELPRDGEALITLGGEGTVLFRAPHNDERDTRWR